MDDFFRSGLAADIVAALMFVEALWLLRRQNPRQWAATLAAGGCLVFALRGALTGAAWPWIALWLSAGGVAHALDLWLRLRRPGGA